MTLVFVVMFATIFIALSGLVSQQSHQGTLDAQDETAFQIAEAGLNFGRWRLAHDPDDFSTITQNIEDQFAGVIGSYTVTFTQPQLGSTITEIQSVGVTANQPSRESTLRARYGIPSLARYASITNEDVWYGGTIQGYVHSNGGIRMDGYSDSIVASSRETYVCQPKHGCSNQTRPGVWGTGEEADLWEFPVPPVDYNSITLDLQDMKAAAQDAGTYYGGSGSFGYHIVFNSNNTYSVYVVTQKTSPLWSYTSDGGWEYLSHDINNETLLETDDVPSNGVLFFEDNVWVNGDIRDRVTVAAGVFPDQPSTNVDIILNGSISYDGVTDGSRAFGAVAQRNVQIPYSGAPNNFILDGAYIAQKGRFGRRHYYTGSHILKNSLTRYGMIASNLTPGTAWVNGGGTVISGYQTGTSSYDPNMLYGPPPFFPTTGEYEFLSWEEVN